MRGTPLGFIFDFFALFMSGNAGLRLFFFLPLRPAESMPDFPCSFSSWASVDAAVFFSFGVFTGFRFAKYLSSSPDSSLSPFRLSFLCLLHTLSLPRPWLRPSRHHSRPPSAEDC